MKHWNKVLVAAAVICGVTGIAWSARLVVSTAYRYSEGRKLVYGTQEDYWSENESDEEDVFDESLMPTVRMMCQKKIRRCSVRQRVIAMRMSGST